MQCEYCREEIAREATKCYRCGEYFGYRRVLRLFVGVIPIIATLLASGTALYLQEVDRREAVDRSITAIDERGAALFEAEGAKNRVIEVESNLAMVQFSAEQAVTMAEQDQRAAIEAESFAVELKDAAIEAEALAMNQRDVAIEAEKMANIEKDAAIETEKLATIEKDAAIEAEEFAISDSLAQRSVAMSLAGRASTEDILESARQELGESSQDYIVLRIDPRAAVEYFEAELKADPGNFSALKGLTYAEILGR